MRKPLAIDLFAGLGGWTEGLLAEGYDVVGFDIERHDYGDGMRYPAQLVLQDVMTIVGRQFKDAALIVASSPCQKYSYMAMPWTRAKDLAKWYRDPDHPERLIELNALFDQPARIQREACEAAGRYIPMVQENVRGAIPWVGRSRWNFGSFHLWGDVPALMPMIGRRATKNNGGSWFNIAHNTTSGKGQNPDGRLLEREARTDIGPKSQTQGEVSDMSSQQVRHRSKAASAAIAKIPMPLAQHIARCWRP